ncbi:hypothetical protein Pelo_1771 [Pelomyxa schiedti]|nr:hypothetical protein Pelo_1771 [Pelomyxa schiedti]
MSTEDKCHSTHPSNGDATKPHGEGDVESGNKHAEKDAEVAADQPSEVTECTVSAAHSPTTSADVGVGAGVSVSVPVGPGACAVGKAVEEFGVSEPEDKVPRLRFFCSLSEIAERYGVGVYLYFDFLRFVMILNFIVSVLVLCNWVPQVAMYDIDTVADNLEALFVSGYPPTLLIVWQVTSGVACGTVALFGFLYVIHARNVQKSSPEAEKPPEQNSLWEYELMPQTPGDMGFIERNMKVNNCSKAGKPRAEIHFDLSAQYMDALFRQYMMYLGMTVFPCLCLLTLATTIIMYQMDKFRLVKLCTTKKKSIGSMRYYLAIIMFLTAILGVVMFPSGGVWTLSGLPGDSYCHCTIYNDTCPPENATSEVESNSWFFCVCTQTVMAMSRRRVVPEAPKWWRLFNVDSAAQWEDDGGAAASSATGGGAGLAAALDAATRSMCRDLADTAYAASDFAKLRLPGPAAERPRVVAARSRRKSGGSSTTAVPIIASGAATEQAQAQPQPPRQNQQLTPAMASPKLGASVEPGAQLLSDVIGDETDFGQAYMSAAESLRPRDPYVALDFSAWWLRRGIVTTALDYAKRAIHFDYCLLQPYMTLHDIYALTGNYHKAKQVLLTAEQLATTTSADRANLSKLIVVCDSKLANSTQNETESSFWLSIPNNTIPLTQPLPAFAVCEIAYFLDPFTISALRLVCREWNGIFSSMGFKVQYLKVHQADPHSVEKHWKEDYLLLTAAYAHWNCLTRFHKGTALLKLDIGLPLLSPPCTYTEITQFEAMYGVHLPSDLRYHITLHNGCSIATPHASVVIYPLSKFSQHITTNKYLLRRGTPEVMFSSTPIHKYVIGEANKIHGSNSQPVLLVINLDYSVEAFVGQIACCQNFDPQGVQLVHGICAGFSELITSLVSMFQSHFVGSFTEIRSVKKPKKSSKNTPPRKTSPHFTNYQRRC